MYNIEFHPKVFEDDFEELSNEVLEEVLLYFQKYKQNPFKYSSKLYNLGKLNLEGYRKTYVANATYRIVIKIENNNTLINTAGKIVHQTINPDAVREWNIAANSVTGISNNFNYIFFPEFINQRSLRSNHTSPECIKSF